MIKNVLICPKMCCRRSKYQNCEAGAMTEDDIPVTDQKNSYHCIYCPDTLKTYPRQTKLFEFSRDTNKEE